MNSVEFTRFLNELRAEYGLPPSAELEPVDLDAEDLFMTEEDVAGLRQQEDTPA